MKISIKSDIFNRIQKIRDGAVYESQLCFVAELIQNSQRAKAKAIFFELTTALDGAIVITIKDNGRGCKDPSKVFTLDISGWGSDVYEPFGEGFSSLYQVANKITVQSERWTATLDLQKALKERDLEDAVEVIKTPLLKGFKVTAKLVESVSWEALKKEIIGIGSRIPIDVFLDFHIIEKEKLHFEPFSIQRTIRGLGRVVLAPDNRYNDIHAYFDGRKVTDIYEAGIKGVIAFKEGAVTLKAPDRRNIVSDHKRAKLYNETLPRLKKEVYKTLLIEYPNEVKNFLREIGEALDPREYVKYISFGIKRMNAKIPIREISVAGLSEPVDVLVSLPENLPVSIGESSLSVASRYTSENSKDEIAEIRKLRRKGKVFFLRLEDGEELKKEAALLEYYGIKVIIADKLQAQALEWLKVPHVSMAGQSVETDFSKKRIGAINKKEERILSLLEPVKKHYSLGFVSFANLAQVTRTVIKEKTVSRKKSIPLGMAIGTGREGKILLSRKGLGLRSYPVSYGALGITFTDAKLLMRIIPTLAHEIAHVVYNESDNTLEIYKRQKEIEDVITNLLF